MRTERKVDAIVFDWLREGLEERLAELLRALEQLSEGENVTEHVFDATQALQTIDRVFSMVDIQLVRVLVRTQMAALEPLEEPSDDQTAISAQIESAALLQALLDRMAAGAEIAPASLLPMVNRLRGTVKQPPLDARELAARAFLLQAEHELGKRPHREKGVDEEAELRPLLRRMEREVLAVMRDDWSVLPGLRDLSMQIIAHEPSRSAIIAIRVVGELLRLTESDPDRYAPVLKRAVGRVLQLFRLQLQGRSESVINHAGLDLGASVLLSLLERVDDDERICRDRAGDWREQLDRADMPARFVGLDAQALEAVQQALEEELLATQDVLDLFVRGKRDDLEPLGRILTKFEQMSGVLATLGHPAAAQALADGRERLQAVTRGAELLDDEMLMDLAGTVMLVEQVIDGIPRSMADGDRAEALHDQTVASSIGAIASAAFESLSEAREKINAGLAGQGDGETPSGDPFAQAADRLTGIGEVLRLSGRDAATPLVMALARWSRAQTLGEPVGDEHTLSALSEIFAALEFYLENLRDFSKEIARFLEAPKRRIDDLLVDADELHDTASESPSSHAAPVESESMGEDEPAAPIDDSLATPDELIEFWQVEEEELAEDAPESDRESPSTGVEPVEAETRDQASGEELEAAFDFALDEGEEEQRVAPSAETDDLPDLSDEAAQTPQASEAPADLDTLSLPTDEPAEGDGTELSSEVSETSEDEPDDTALGSMQRDVSSAIAGASDDSRHELDEGPSSTPEETDAAQGVDQPGADAQALTFPEASEEGSAALESALDFGLADDQDELRVDQTSPRQPESADDEGLSVDLPDQPVAAPEEPNLPADEQALTLTETETETEKETEAETEAQAERQGSQGETPSSATSGNGTESAPDEPAALSFGETDDQSSRELESALDFGLADDQDELRDASAESTDNEMAVDLPDQSVEAPELPETEAIDTPADESEAKPDGEAGAEPEDDPMMAEMREVFAEEMAETVPDMGKAAEAWRSREDAEALVTMRRGFHTIKGSGRMVGLETIGDWAWAWERLLNQVIDGKVDGDEATRQGALDAVALMQAALPDLEAGQATPESHWAESRRLAERLESGQSTEIEASSDEAATETPADGESTSSAAPAGATETDSASPEEMSAEAGAVMPVIDDPVLREIFDQEIGGYIDELHREIKAARENGVGLACDNDLVRLLHTTLGSARTAGVDLIASLARYLEDWTRVLAEHQERLGGEELALFAEGADAIEALRRWAVDPSLEQPDTRDLEQRLDIQLQQVLAEYGEVAESAEARDSRQAEEPEPSLTTQDPGAESDAATPPEDVSDGDEVSDSLADESSSVESWTGERPDNQASVGDGDLDDVEDDYADIEHRPDDDPAEQDEDILQIFLDEADELLEQADAYVAHWRVHPHDLESIRLLHRNLHTLKGGARMAGLLNLGDVAHHLEGRLDLARRDESPDNEPLVALVQHSYDVIAGLLDRVRNQQPIPQQRELIGWIRDPDGARRFAERNQDGDGGRQGDAGEQGAPPPTSAEPVAEPTEEPPASSPAESGEASSGFGQEAGNERREDRRDEQVRVAAGSIDAMVNQIGESVLLQSRIDRQVNGFERQLFELQQTVTRLRSQLRRLEIETETQIKADLMEEAGVTEEQFDPLEFDRFTQVQELSRGIMESLGDVANIEESLSSLTEQSQLLLLQQSRLGRKMQDGVLAMRLVRFNDVAGRLRRIVRQVGDEMGRQAELVIENGDAEVDRVTLMAMLPSLEHMLRNSIAHGIESPEERRAAHKSPVGRLVLNIDSGGGNITVSLRDDGRGLDLDAIRRKAIERSLMPADIDISDEEARSLIFLPGFSTAGNLSQVAGRGVGMDVVASATRELGGFVDVDSEQGRYTEIRLNLPLTQAMTRGILIASGDDRYAIPYKGVVAVTRMTGVTLAEHYREEKPQIEHNGEHYPLYYLGELLWGLPPAETAQDVAAIRPIMLFKLGERRFALHVDRQLGGIQLFVKSMGPQLGRIPGMSGATIADDGDVILVLELFELVQQFQRRDYQRRLGTQAALKPARARPSVLVVDDSLTVRKVTARTLERNDYEVVLARDGVEALGLLQDSLPDLVLTDIEMPRMDGFELLGAIRNDRSAADTPVIMISSRTGQKHRARAEALGVSAYLGKPYTELDLIDTIARLLPASTVSGDDEGPGDEHAH